MKFGIYLFFGICVLHFPIAFAIEVSGHISQDTTWHPVNNPYEVVDNVFVDAGVTLTILPGTEVKIQSAQLTCLDDFNDSFWYQNGNNAAKMIWVNGRIIAEGTIEDSIRFTRLQDDFNYYWGCIYINENSEMPIFKHCIVEYSGGTGIAVGNIANAAINVRNGLGIIKKCVLRNNGMGFCAYHVYTRNIEVIDCSFYNSNVNYYVSNIWGSYHLNISQAEENYKPSLVANNYFSSRHINLPSVFYINNINVGCLKLQTYAQNGRTSYFYDNDFTSCITGIYGGNVGDSIFIKNNRFIGGNDGLDLDEAYFEISDNYFDGCDLDTGLESYGKVYNNILSDATFCPSSYLEVYNNIGYNGTYGLLITYRNEKCQNNISINNTYAFDGHITGYFDNCIFLGNENITQYGVSGNPTFRNCILDFELPPECIDGGGNIIVDSLQAQSIFEDIQNGDFHLAAGSIAIDAGFDTLGYYYPFDLDYNHRVWDGDNNGTTIIDIGPYEYGAPAFGGIQGSTYDPISGLPVDYVLIKIDNIAGEFTFSDSIGSYEYKLPAGVYDVYAERVFYDDAVEYQIEVLDGQFTQLDIAMGETVEVEEHEIPHNSSLISHLSNYPNPFNPTTTIAFNLSSESDVSIYIYNIKGQKVKSLDVLECVNRVDANARDSRSTYSIIWNGTNDNNQPVSSGIYFVRLNTGKIVAMKKMLLLK